MQPREITMASQGNFLCATLVAVLSILSLPEATLGWASGGATWYGDPHGDGSEGGACGYTSTVGQKPISAMIAGGGPSIFKDGKGCGACYKVKCTSHPACSGHKVNVVITDQCPAGGACSAENAHFDMSGTAFGAMAKKGKEDELRNAGVVKIEFDRVPCKYHGHKINFKMDVGANPFYLCMLIEYANGDGDLTSVDVMEHGGKEWKKMDQSWGATYKLNSNTGKPWEGPFSFRLTSSSGKVLIANGVVPKKWKAGRTYHSMVNYIPEK